MDSAPDFAVNLPPQLIRTLCQAWAEFDAQFEAILHAAVDAFLSCLQEFNKDLDCDSNELIEPTIQHRILQALQLAGFSRVSLAREVVLTEQFPGRGAYSRWHSSLSYHNEPDNITPYQSLANQPRKMRRELRLTPAAFEELFALVGPWLELPFRFSKEFFDLLEASELLLSPFAPARQPLGDFLADLSHKGHRLRVLDSRTMLLNFLRSLRNRDSVTRSASMMSMSEGAMSTHFRHVLWACWQAMNFMRWPSSENIAEAWRQQPLFERQNWPGLPIAGYVDGTITALPEGPRPRNLDEYWCERKDKYGFNNLITVSITGEIINAICGLPSRRHDSFVFRTYFNVNLLTSSNCRLIGDCGFIGITDQVLTSHKRQAHQSLTDQQRIENKAVSFRRSLVERVFADLKKLFPIVKQPRPVHFSMIPYITLTCCHLYNFVLSRTGFVGQPAADFLRELYTHPERYALIDVHGNFRTYIAEGDDFSDESDESLCSSDSLSGASSLSGSEAEFVDILPVYGIESMDVVVDDVNREFERAIQRSP